ncbi:MAG: hypothetical protein HYZ45_02815, partial [Burkholderiales bacterium]|nr:hypothetical protein [Burkholderiales bacterium]
MTDATNNNIRDHHFSVSAHHVVLAAGTLGSTEILLRSREKGLKLSNQLGSRFSGNGDMIWAGYQQKDKVNPGSEAHQAYAERKVGPTITAMLDLRQRSPHPHVVQDAAVPAGLYRVFSELVTTTNVLYRMARRSPDERSTQLQIDPDAVNPSHLQHTAVYLTMGLDEAAGEMEYVPKDEDGHG